MYTACVHIRKINAKNGLLKFFLTFEVFMLNIANRDKNSKLKVSGLCDTD